MKNNLFKLTAVAIAAASLSACAPFAVDEGEIGLVTKYGEIVEQVNAGAEIVRVNAQAQADAQVIKAKARAEATKIAGEAEAYAIRAKGEALKENRQLVDLTTAEKWDGKLPATMTPNSTVPFINIGGK